MILNLQGAIGSMRDAVEPPIALLPHEIGQKVVPAPSDTADTLVPGIIIGAHPAHVSQGVDRASAANQVTLRDLDRTSAQRRLRDRYVALEIVPGPEQHLERAGRHVDKKATMTPARFQQKHSGAMFHDKMIGGDATCAPATDHDIVVFRHQTLHQAARLKSGLPPSSMRRRTGRLDGNALHWDRRYLPPWIDGDAQDPQAPVLWWV